MLEFFDSEACKGTASIYENHITFNKSLVSYFETAYRVRVGIDRENKKVYFFIINKDKALSGEIPETSLLPVSLAKSYSRVCSRAMVEYICNAFDLTINKKDFIRFQATYDDGKKAVIVDLNKGGEV